MAHIICYYRAELKGWCAWISETGASGDWEEIPGELVSDDGAAPCWAIYGTKKEAKAAGLHMWNVKYGADDYLDTCFADYDTEQYAMAA